ncbi:MAG: hypothetical protein ACRDHG_10080, partial [Anaerolineales bacterium]
PVQPTAISSKAVANSPRYWGEGRSDMRGDYSPVVSDILAALPPPLQPSIAAQIPSGLVSDIPAAEFGA